MESSGQCFCGELGFGATDQNEGYWVCFDDGRFSLQFVLLEVTFTYDRVDPPIMFMSYLISEWEFGLVLHFEKTTLKSCVLLA